MDSRLVGILHRTFFLRNLRLDVVVDETQETASLVVPGMQPRTERTKDT